MPGLTAVRVYRLFEDGEVGLSVPEFRKESVFENIYLIDVLGNPLVNRPAAVIANFERSIRTQLALEPDVPGLRVGLPNMRIDSAEVDVTESAIRKVNGAGVLRRLIGK